MAVILPEVIIADEIQASIDILTAELNDSSIADEDTVLYKYFGDTSISNGQYVMFDQMKDLLTTDSSKVDKALKVFQAMPPKDTKNPSVFVQMADESHEGGGNAIGDGVDIYNVEFDEDSQEYQDFFAKKYMSRYLVVVICENGNDMIALFHLIRCCLISSSHSIALKGLENYKVRATSSNLKQQIDYNMFYKTLEVKFEYGIVVPNLEKNKYYLELNLNGTLVSDE